MLFKIKNHARFLRQKRLYNFIPTLYGDNSQTKIWASFNEMTLNNVSIWKHALSQFIWISAGALVLNIQYMSGNNYDSYPNLLGSVAVLLAYSISIFSASLLIFAYGAGMAVRHLKALGGLNNIIQAQIDFAEGKAAPYQNVLCGRNGEIYFTHNITDGEHNLPLLGQRNICENDIREYGRLSEEISTFAFWLSVSGVVLFIAAIFISIWFWAVR